MRRPDPDLRIALEHARLAEHRRRLAREASKLEADGQLTLDLWAPSGPEITPEEEAAFS